MDLCCYETFWQKSGLMLLWNWATHIYTGIYISYALTESLIVLFFSFCAFCFFFLPQEIVGISRQKPSFPERQHIVFHRAAAHIQILSIFFLSFEFEELYVCVRCLPLSKVRRKHNVIFFFISVSHPVKKFVWSRFFFQSEKILRGHRGLFVNENSKPIHNYIIYNVIITSSRV